jgi:DNA polymerase-3 subunit epsilon
LPTTQPKSVERIPVGQGSRPEYYDFDLFNQPGQTPELDQRPLSELVYTVFDTETTGLNPSGGDEIISISAVRIVNGRLLRQEIFDQLVDPKRDISSTSINIHGILPEMLKGQPTIEQVLPLVYKFAEGTVLVGHNAAFDMRLLQLKEATTGIKFTNPVLDTLLLSAVTYPNQKDHSLETIARRLGINIVGRHSSLGDAILTGEIFLKLIPLLIEQNVITLKDARQAAEETFHARLNY